MQIPAPEDFPRAFAAAFASQNAVDLAAMMAEDADLLTPTGQWAEGRTAIKSALTSEFSGIFRAARLITGRLRLRPLGPGAIILSQRFVLIGAVDETGAELPRSALMLGAVLVARPEGWQVMTASLTALSD
jgi:uncharacterized protein (TIGR02246 family)